VGETPAQETLGTVLLDMLVENVKTDLDLAQGAPPGDVACQGAESRQGVARQDAPHVAHDVAVVVLAGVDEHDVQPPNASRRRRPHRDNAYAHRGLRSSRDHDLSSTYRPL
jgi:hypothetical protein